MSDLICGIDVGSSKICALMAEVDEDNGLHVIGVGRLPAAGIRRGVVANTADATAAIGQAIAEAEQTAGAALQRAYVSVSGHHITAQGSKGVVALGRGRNITSDDMQRALDASKSIAVPHNREILYPIPRSFSVDEQQGIESPVGMFGYRLEVDATVLTGSSSANTNLAQCIVANRVAVEELVPAPLASGESVLTEDERRLGVMLVDVGHGTTDISIYLEGALWHVVILELGGDHLIRDVATGLRMPQSKAEALIKQFGHVLPDQVPPDAEVRGGAFGEGGQQVISRRFLAQILNSRAEELLDLVVLEVKRSGYDSLLPAGMVLTGGVAQLCGFGELARSRLDWPVRVGHPAGLVSSVSDISSPEFASSVGLLLWGLRQGTTPRVATPPSSQVLERIWKAMKSLLPS